MLAYVYDILIYRENFTECSGKFLSLVNRFSEVVKYKAQKTQLHSCLLIVSMQKLELKIQYLLQLLQKK